MQKEEILNYLKKNKNEFYQKYGITKIGLFGSYAKDMQKEDSDIDLVIEMEKSKKRLKNFLGFKRELEEFFGKEMDIGIESALKPVVKKSIKILYV